MVIAWIINSVSIDIASSVMCFDITNDIWFDMNERFGQSNETKDVQIQRESSGTSQESSNIASYFTKMCSR